MPLHLRNSKINKVYVINKSATIGRSDINGIVLPSNYIGRVHCKVALVQNKYVIQDLHSVNGTWVNGKRIEDNQTLHEGDEITFGFDDENLSVEIKQSKDTIIPKPEFNFNRKVFLFSVLILSMVMPFLFLSFISIRSNKLDTVKQMSLEEIIIEKLKKYDEPEEFINDESLNRIKHFISYYKGTRTFKLRSENRLKYIEMIEKVFKDNKIPVDYSYIAFIESGYYHKAYNSYSGARGMWQFMPATARGYGVKVNRSIDERIDPLKSTQAASSYIKDMLGIFGYDSFLLVSASFNCGDGTLRAALKQIDDPKSQRSFFYLSKQGLIPQETREYVAKIIAVMILTEYPDLAI